MQISVQLGKKGLTDTFIESLKNTFSKTENNVVRISVLKNLANRKKEIHNIAEKIISELGRKYTYKIIGFSIFIKKWRKVRG